jgi:uncharacterized protein YegP (UPF0339 family)
LTTAQLPEPAVAEIGLRLDSENLTERVGAPFIIIGDRRKSVDGQDYFVLTAGNNEIIGQSEMYRAPAGMENGLQAVMRVAAEAPVSDRVGSPGRIRHAVSGERGVAAGLPFAAEASLLAVRTAQVGKLREVRRRRREGRGRHRGDAEQGRSG